MPGLGEVGGGGLPIVGESSPENCFNKCVTVGGFDKSTESWELRLFLATPAGFVVISPPAAVTEGLMLVEIGSFCGRSET